MRLVIAVFLFLTLGAQAIAATVRVPRIEYDMQLLGQSPQLLPAELKGRRLFVQYCALCHDAVGSATDTPMGPVLSREALQAIGEARALAAIRTGSARMPGFRYQLTATDTEQLLAFIRTLTSAPQSTERARSSARSGVAPAALPAAAQQTAALRGRIRTDTGEPLAGAAVSAKAAGSTVTSTVFTDSVGSYRFPPLSRNRYRLWAQATGYATARAEVDLTARGATTLPLSLRKLENPADILPQLSSAEWLNTLPGRTREEQRMKEVFRLNCSNCHQANLVLQRRFDEPGWAAIIQAMRWVASGGKEADAQAQAPRPGQEQTNATSVFLQHYSAELAKYLASVRGPASSPLSLQLLPRPTGAAARVVVTSYDIPPAETPTELAWHDGSDWSEGAAAGMHGTMGVHDVAIDDQGNAWLTDSRSNDARSIIKVDATTGQVTGFLVPGRRSPWKAMWTHGITRDSRGALWFSGEQVAGKIDPKTELFQLFVPSSAETARKITSLTVDADAQNRIWLSATDGAVRLDPATGVFSYYQNLTPTGFPESYGVAADAVGNGWWTTAETSELVKTVAPDTGRVREILMRPPWAADEEALATPAERAFFVLLRGQRWGGFMPETQYPRRLGADRNGTAVWVPNWWGRNLARIDIHSHAVTYHRLPIPAQPYFVTVDKHHVAWTNLMSDDRVAAFDPRTQQWTLYRLPINGCESRHITVDDRTGDVWVPCFRASKLLRLQFPTP